MFSRIMIVATVPFLVFVTALAQGPLPMRQIVLFKNGMAQIVRIGELTEPTSLAFHEEKSLRDLYVRQFGTQESQLSALRSEVKGLDQRLQGARREVEETILAIVWE